MDYWLVLLVWDYEFPKGCMESTYKKKKKKKLGETNHFRLI